MSETILLTGSSGFIAKHVAVVLLKAGYTLRATLRRLDRADEVRAAVAPALADPGALGRLSFVQADLEADSGWADAMAGVSAVVHTASPFPIAEPKDPAALIRPAVEGTERVLSAASRAGVRRVVLTSSTVAVIDTHRTRPQDEADWCDTEAANASAYARSKTLAERRAWELATRDGMALTTINPGFVIGPPLDAHFGSSISVVERLLNGRDPLLPDIGFPMVDVRDVAEMHLRALQRPETAGKRYIAVAGTMNMVEMGRCLKAAYPNRRIPTGKAPKPLLRLLALFDPQIRAILPDIGKSPIVDNARARREMGMDFLAPQDSIKAAAAWLIAHRSGR